MGIIDSSREVLSFIQNEGIIDLSCVQEMMKMHKREEFLNKHPYKVWEGNDGKWYTYLPDKTKGRVLKKRVNKADLENLIVEYWKQEIENPTVKEVYEEWITDKLNREEISIATKNRYDRQFNECLGVFGQRRIKNINAFEVEKFILNAIYEHSLTYKGYSNLRTLVYGIFVLAKKKGLISFSIYETIKEMKISKKLFRVVQKEDDELVFMEDEVPKVLDYICNGNKDMKNLGILLLFKTGLRPGELSALEWEDIGENVIHICKTEIHYETESKEKVYMVRDFPKTEAGIRYVYIPEKYGWILKELRKLNPFGKYVFEKDGERIKTYQFSQRLETICKRAGVKGKSLNKIRKTYGSILVDANVDESFITSQMGHTDIKTTKTYYYKNRKRSEQKAFIINNVAGL